MKTTRLGLTTALTFALGGGIVVSAPASAATLTGELQLTGGLELPNTMTILFSPDEDDLDDAAPVGEYAFTTIGPAENSGSFDIYNVPNADPPGEAQSYLGELLSIDAAEGLPVEDFVLLPGVDSPPDPTTGATSIAPTSITLLSVETEDLGVENGFQEFSFSGDGIADNEGDTIPVRFDFTAQGDVSQFGFAGDLPPMSVPVDVIAQANFSYSGTIVPERQGVPESSSVLPLLGLGALGGLLLVRRRKQDSSPVNF